MSWLMVKPGSPPPARSHHSASVIGNVGNMVVFGGWNGVQYLNDLCLLERGARWITPTTRGSPPSPRSMHSSVTLGNKVIFYGGFDGENFLEDVHVLDTDSWTWQFIKTGGVSPGGRCGHTATLMNGKEMWVLGGKFSARGFCDFHEFHVLDTDTWSWERRQAKGDPADAPSPRAWHTTTVMGPKENFYVFGGKSQNDIFNDMYIFSSTTKRWTRVSTSNPPSPRACHTTLSFGELLITFGGEYASGDAKKSEVFNDIYILFTASMQWRCPRVSFGRTGEQGEEAAAYTQHTMVMLSKSKIAVFGGIRQDFVKESRSYNQRNVYCGDLLILYHIEKFLELNTRFALENPKKFFKDKKSTDKEKKKMQKKDKKKEKESKDKKTYAKGAAVNSQVRLLRSSTVGDAGIGLPFNLQHNVHVDLDWNWSGKAEDVFEIQEKLGEGAYGAVYKGMQRETGFVLAIKEIFQGGNYEDLKREIEILKTCKNRNVVCYYGTATTVDQSLWILMDYCSAGSVRDMIEICEAALTEEQVAFVCKEALMGLLYLHARKIIHRDVKAANILLDSEGTVKIADFGVSQQLSEHTVSERIGTPLWMAPEVMQGRKYNERCDIWSLGITAIEMADGLPPNHELNAARAMRLIPAQPPPTLEDPSEWTEQFNEFVKSCLVKEPDTRPSAADLLPHRFLTSSKGPDIIKQRIEECMLIKVAKKAKKEEDRLNGRHNSNSEEDGSARFGTLVASAAEDASPVRYPTVDKVDDADDSGKFSTMVVNGDGDGGDGYSTMVVTGEGDDGGGDGFSTMVVRGGGGGGEDDGGDAFSTMVMRDDEDGGDAFSTTVMRDNEEGGQYKAAMGGQQPPRGRSGSGGAGAGAGATGGQFMDAVRRAGGVGGGVGGGGSGIGGGPPGRPAPATPAGRPAVVPSLIPHVDRFAKNREEMLSMLGGSGPIVVPGSPTRPGGSPTSIGAGSGIGWSGGGAPPPIPGGAPKPGPTPPGRPSGSPSPPGTTVTRRPVAQGAPPPLQPFNLPPPPDIPPPKNPAELAAAQQQGKTPTGNTPSNNTPPPVAPRGGSGVKVGSAKPSPGVGVGVAPGSSTAELLEHLKPLIGQMIEEEVQRRVAEEVEIIKANLLASLGK